MEVHYRNIEIKNNSNRRTSPYFGHSSNKDLHGWSALHILRTNATRASQFRTTIVWLKKTASTCISSATRFDDFN